MNAQDYFAGTTQVSSGWVVLLPYKDMLKRGKRWMLWLTNAGPDPVNVQFTVSPDGVCPDAESTQAAPCPAGQSISVYGDGLHRYWAISAQSSTSNLCTVSWGATVDYQ